MEENDPEEQQKRVCYTDIIANALMLQNVADLTEALQKLGDREQLSALSRTVLLEKRGRVLPARQPGHHRREYLHMFVEHHEVRDAEAFAFPLNILCNLLHTADEQVRILQ